MIDAFLQAAPVAGVALGLISGALVGSFLATILLRWPEKRSALHGRSSCDSCNVQLRAHELVPILSYMFARGRCRRCGARIDPRHFGIELAAAMIGCVALLAHPGSGGLATAALGWWLLLLAALDAEHHWLPDKLTLPLIPVGLGIALIGIGPPLEQRLIGAAVGFALLAMLAVIYRAIRGREGLGGGDPKLLAGLGAWLGWVQLPFVLLGAGLLGIVAIALMTMKGRRVAATDPLPLGTLMALAAWPIWLLIAA